MYESSGRFILLHIDNIQYYYIVNPIYLDLVMRYQR